MNLKSKTKHRPDRIHLLTQCPIPVCLKVMGSQRISYITLVNFHEKLPRCLVNQLHSWKFGSGITKLLRCDVNLLFRLDMLIPLRPRCEDTFQQAKMLPIFLICLSNSDQISQDALICAETSAWLACISSCLNHFEPTPFGLTWSDKMLSRSHFSEGRCDRNHGNSHGQGIFKLFRTAQTLHFCRENRGASWPILAAPFPKLKDIPAQR